MNALKNILDGVLLRRELYVKIKGNLALLQWDRIVGDKLMKYTTPLFYKEGKLFIGVTSPLFMRELTLMKGDIIRKINESIVDSPISDIKFKLVSSVKNRLRKTGRKEEYISYKTVELTREDVEWIDSTVDKLKADEKLKKKYRELLVIYKKNEKLKERMHYKRCAKCGALFKGEGPLCPVCKLEDKNHQK